MKKGIFVVFFVLFSLSSLGQMKITSFSEDVKGLQTVKKFFDEHKEDIDTYNGKIITLADILVVIDYWNMWGGDHLFAIFKEYEFKDDYNLSEQTFYMRKKGDPNRLIPASKEKVSKLQPTPGSEPFSFYMPTEFIISVGNDRGFKVVKFRRKIKCDYIIEQLK